MMAMSERDASRRVDVDFGTERGVAQSAFMEEATDLVVRHAGSLSGERARLPFEMLRGTPSAMAGRTST